MMRAFLDRIGKGGLVAAVAVLLAAGTIAWRIHSDAHPAGEAAPGPAIGDPVANLAKAAEADPKDPGGWQRLGFALFDAGRFAEAADAYRRATDAAPGNAVLWSSLGEALVMASERDPMPVEALKAFRKAVAIDAGDPRARYFLAVKKDIDGDHRGAIDAWLALLADTPADAPWEADLRRTIEQVGKINAIPVDGRIEQALAGRPAPAEPGLGHPALDAIPGPSQDQLAAASRIPPGEQRGMAEAMVARLAARQASEPTNVEGWVMLMRSYRTLGRDKEAAKALADAVAANPGRRAELESAAATLGVTG